ncbi:MAG: hypothetical protein QOG65_1611 [Actinomycetota bacterium]|nr:hypothetical protein [Actinomycetota bacterium]
MAVSTAVRRIGAVVVTVAVLAAAVVVGVRVFRHHKTPPPACVVSRTTAGSGNPPTISYTLAIDQAANSTTIATVGKRLGLPDHAVTVALAAALQESKLHNLPYGDRDSLGLFQQRPSQGWGTTSEILTPSYAAAAFYRELKKVDGWQALPINDAAQKVQRSGAPTAYMQWESEARTIAAALTGEITAGLTCRFALAPSPEPPPSPVPSLANEVGVSSLDRTFATAQGWTIASWLVAHAEQFRIVTVSYGGREWRASTGRWRANAPNESRVRYSQQPVAA